MQPFSKSRKPSSVNLKNKRLRPYPDNVQANRHGKIGEPQPARAEKRAEMEMKNCRYWRGDHLRRSSGDNLVREKAGKVQNEDIWLATAGGYARDVLQPCSQITDHQVRLQRRVRIYLRSPFIMARSVESVLYLSV